jgi:PAS domain S-box-containing protein
VKRLPDRRLLGRVRSFWTAVENNPAAIVVTDARGTIEYVNSQFSRMTGWSEEEAIGRNPRFLKSGYHSPAFYRDLWETILDGRIWQGEFRNRRKDGGSTGSPPPSPP